MGDENPIRTLGDYSKPSHEGYKNTIELPVGNNVNDPRDFTKPVKAIALPQDVPSTSDRRLNELKTQVQRLMEAHLAPKRPTQVNKITTSCEIYSGPHDTQYCMENPEQAFIDCASSGTDEAGAGTLPSDMVKNPKLGTHLVLSARSYPTMDPQCSTQIHSSINAITIHPKQQSDSHDRTEDNEEEKRGSSENHPNSPTPPNPSISFVTEKVLKFNSLFESLGLVPSSPNAELVCTKEEDGDVMFIEIISKDDNSHKEGPKVGVQEVEYFDIFPTRSELAHVHVEKSYIDLNSPLNIMTRMMYNWIMRRKLDPRENANGGISNFTGRIKGMHVFVGNFTYVVDFMIFEDISSIIDPRLSQVVLGRPFIEISNMTHDLPEGVVRFTHKNDEVAYKMPHKIEQYNSLLNLEKEHTKSVYFRNEEDKRRGVDYVISKILGFYKECLGLGPEYVTRLDDEGEVM
ncbi:MAK10-like protein [Tanacetum coccineum]